MRLGGAGNKCLHVALQRVDLYMAAGLSYWDLCAPDVLVRAMGGHITDISGYPVNYRKESKSASIRGLILAKNKHYHNLICERLDRK